jgi:beta-galactosidase/beta-glucuronidase
MTRVGKSVVVGVVLVAAALGGLGFTDAVRHGARSVAGATTTVGTRAEPAADPAAEQVDAAHPPAAWGGPDGRRALDEGWVERDDPHGVGLRRGWRRGTFIGREVEVPFSPNAGVVRGTAGMRSFAGSIAWFRTTLTVPADGDYALRFESVNHRAMVWVDGRRVARHVGAYLPFDVPLSLTAGEHRVVVRADWRSPRAMKVAGWGRSWFNFGGINREVTVRPLGASVLEAPAVQTRLAHGAAVVTVSVRVRNRTGGPRTVRVSGDLGGRPLPFGALRLAGQGARTARATLRIDAPELWAPGHPALQDLHLAVPGEAGWSERVGLRELRWRGGRLRLNGRALRLHGASLQEEARGHGDALTAADMDGIVARLQAIGANATRALHALSPALVERLDAAGILVWQEIGPVDAPGNWTSRTPFLRRRALQRDITSVEQLRVHPSILTWMLGNEVAHDGHPGGQAGYVDTAARRLHRLDPGRPVALDVWGSGLPASADSLLYRHVDAIGVTMYEGWYQRPGEPLASVGPNLDRRLAAVHAIFGRRVVVVSEFGAEANALNPAAGPGGPRYQARLLGREIRVFDADQRLDGWLVWSLQDFALIPTFGGGSIREALPQLRLVPGINQKGLFTYSGTPKPAVRVVRRLSG